MAPMAAEVPLRRPVWANRRLDWRPSPRMLALLDRQVLGPPQPCGCCTIRRGSFLLALSRHDNLGEASAQASSVPIVLVLRLRPPRSTRFPARPAERPLSRPTKTSSGPSPQCLSLVSETLLWPSAGISFVCLALTSARFAATGAPAHLTYQKFTVLVITTPVGLDILFIALSLPRSRGWLHPLVFSLTSFAPNLRRHASLACPVGNCMALTR